MGDFSIWHWLVVLLVVLLLFGGGKISGLMGDLAKGIRRSDSIRLTMTISRRTAVLTKPIR